MKVRQTHSQPILPRPFWGLLAIAKEMPDDTAGRSSEEIRHKLEGERVFQ